LLEQLEAESDDDDDADDDDGSRPGIDRCSAGWTRRLAGAVRSCTAN